MPKPAHPRRTKMPTVSLIGCGNWGTALALALRSAKVPLHEIILSDTALSKRATAKRTRHLAATTGARLTTLSNAAFDADILWIVTPDAAISSVAKKLAAILSRKHSTQPIVFHSSGALPSAILAPLTNIAAVHPLMTFPTASTTFQLQPGVPFAIEGDPRAVRAARTLILALGGEPFVLPAKNKPLYHAFGAFSSPLLVAALTAAVETAVAAGASPQQARRRMRPIVERTVANFFADGPAKSFSGPIARGDSTTVARHLQALHAHPPLLALYRELTAYALHALPAKNRKQIEARYRTPLKKSRK